jgi:hypothetical protein
VSKGGCAKWSGIGLGKGLQKDRSREIGSGKSGNSLVEKMEWACGKTDIGFGKNGNWLAEKTEIG